ncbi:MAG: GDP-L-fucose synthase [Thermodesulfobacteriota bacterium]
MFKDSRIYVAGHTGLLGSALVKKLSAGGRRNIITRGRAELDLTSQSCVREFFKTERPEYVFLAAGLTGGIAANKAYPADFFHTNIAMQDNVFEACRAHGIKRVVFYGSSCVYPRSCPQPMKEEYIMTGHVEETSEGYAMAKLAGIKACKAYNAQDNVNRFIALIPNSMYGPGDNFDVENSHVLSSLIRKLSDAFREEKKSITLWGSGNPKREFIFNSDVAAASIFAMENADKLENACYNLGTGVECSIKELASMIAGAVGFKGVMEWDTSKPDGTPRKLLDSSRFKSLGWNASVGLEDGIKATCLWYEENYLKAGQCI